MAQINIATDIQIIEIRRHAVNDVTREIMAHGVLLTHEQADDLGEETLDWMSRRLGLIIATTDRGVECRPTPTVSGMLTFPDGSRMQVPGLDGDYDAHPTTKVRS